MTVVSLNAVTRKLSPSAASMIRFDHAHTMAQFHKIHPGTSAGVRDAAIRSLCAELELHAQLEEEIFYPALRSAGVSDPALDEAVPEHDEMRRLIARVRSLQGSRREQDEALNELLGRVLHHVADEESQLLPAAERLLGPDQLADLGARMTARRVEIAGPQAPALVSDLARAAPAKTALLAVGALLAGTMLFGRLRRNGARSA